MGRVLAVNKSIKGLSVIVNSPLSVYESASSSNSSSQSEFKTEKIEDGDLEEFKAGFEKNTTLKMLEFRVSPHFKHFPLCFTHRI